MFKKNNMNIFETIYNINKHHPDKRAMSITMSNGNSRMFTYGTVFKKINQYSQTLLNSGVKEGDRIALISESSPEWNIAFLASCKIKATASLIDASLTGEEIDDYICRSDVRAAFLSPRVAEKMGDFSKYKFPFINILDNSIYNTSVNKVSPELSPSQDVDPNVACIIFSSGTTRKSAGIMHYHESMIKTAEMTIKLQKLGENDRYLGIIPNSHIYGLLCLLLGPLLTGSDVHFLDSITSDSIMNAFAEYHPTILPAVPKVYELFYNAIMRKINSNKTTKLMFDKLFPLCYKLRKKNGSLLGKKIFSSVNKGLGGSLYLLCCAGAPLSKEVADFYFGVGLNIISTYGATETNIPTIGNVPWDIQTDSCGKPYPEISVKINDSGELLIKSPFMMKGYFRDEESTKNAFDEDGWFLSGDVGFIDENENVHITGRSKENIVLATGKKVTPDDIEELYSNIPGVREMVICGVSLENKSYDEIHMFVVPDSPDVKKEIEERIKEKSANLVNHMKIAKVHFVNEIPRTSLSKPKRYLLKKLAMEQENIQTHQTTEMQEETTLSKMIKIVAKVACVKKEDISETTKVFQELTIDSLSSVDMAIEIESTFGVNIEKHFTHDITVADMVCLAENPSQTEEKISEISDVYPKNKTNSDYRAYNVVRKIINAFHKVNVDGTDNIPNDKGYIICANHVSKLDLMYISMALSKEKFQKFCCMAKKELFRNDPISRQLIKSTGMVPVDRSGLTNSKSMQSLIEKLNDNWGVLIHPEGTRSKDGIFRTMKNGASVLAIDANVPIIPAYINGAFEACPKGTKLINFYNWDKKQKYHIDVKFGKPIYPDDKTVNSLTEEVQNAILTLQDELKMIENN